MALAFPFESRPPVPLAGFFSQFLGASGALCLVGLQWSSRRSLLPGAARVAGRRPLIGAAPGASRQVWWNFGAVEVSGLRTRVGCGDDWGASKTPTAGLGSSLPQRELCPPSSLACAPLDIGAGSLGLRKAVPCAWVLHAARIPTLPALCLTPLGVGLPMLSSVFSGSPWLFSTPLEALILAASWSEPG